MPSRERSGEEVSQPIEHSPGPWEKGWGMGRAAIFDKNGDVIARFGAGDGPLDVDMSLIVVAPTMYRIIRQICNEDWQCREQGLRSAQFLLQELEGRLDAEA
jgi:hypothetical protein